MAKKHDKKAKVAAPVEPAQPKEISVPPEDEPTHAIPKQWLYAGLAVVAIAIVAVLWYAFSAAPAPASTPTVLLPAASPVPMSTKLVVIKDASCLVCNSKNVVEIMQQAFSGIEVAEIDSQSPEAKTLVASLGIRALPAYVFNSAVENEANFSLMAGGLAKSGNNYFVDDRVRGLIERYFDQPSTEGEPATAASADLTIIEFADPACGACRAFYTESKPMLEQAFGDRVRFVFKSLPLSEDTVNASIAMDCAGGQGKFWEFAGLLFNGTGFDNVTLESYAESLGLNTTAYNACLTDQARLDEVMLDRSEGITYGVSGTPTLFINGIKITGVPADEDLKAIVETELAA